jgi:hypothetical protein
MDQGIAMNNSPETHINLVSVLSYLGAALIFLGIASFVSINWEVLPNGIKIFSTLGSALASFLIGLRFYLENNYQRLSSAFFMLSALLLPIGISVTQHILLISPLSWSYVELSSICFLLFLLSHIYLQRNILLLFTIIFGTFLFLSTVYFINDYFRLEPQGIFEYTLMATGFSYIFLGMYFNGGKTQSLTGLLYFFGILFILGTSFALDGSFFFASNMPTWKFITGILIIASMLLAIPLQSKSFLYIGAIFLILYITDISNQLIKIWGKMGWPLVLILMGLLIIFIGYMCHAIKKKFR